MDLGKLQRTTICWERDNSGTWEISSWEGNTTGIHWQAVSFPGSCFVTQKLYRAISHPLQTALIVSKVTIQWLPNLIRPRNCPQVTSKRSSEGTGIRTPRPSSDQRKCVSIPEGQPASLCTEKFHSPQTSSHHGSWESSFCQASPGTSGACLCKLLSCNAHRIIQPSQVVGSPNPQKSL